jgi:hypothetical protein
VGKKYSVTASVSAKEYEMFRAWVERNGDSMSGWVRKVLLQEVPAEMRSHYLGEDPVEASPQAPRTLVEKVVETAQAIVTPKPAPRPLEPLEELKAAPREKLHTCMYLKAYYMQPWGPNDCQGTCSSPRQTGKPCHWPAGTAASCPAFRPFRMG